MSKNFLGNQIPKPKARVRSQAYRGQRRAHRMDREIVRVGSDRFEAERRDGFGRIISATVRGNLVPGQTVRRYEQEISNVSENSDKRLTPQAAVATFVVVRIKVDFIATCPKCKLFVRSIECHERCLKCKSVLKWTVSTKEGRSQLNRCSKMFGVIFTPIYGPRVVVDDDNPGMVEIVVRNNELDVPIGELVAGGWRLLRAGSNSRQTEFVAPATAENLKFVRNWSWRYAGEWFTVRKMTQEAKTWLILQGCLSSMEQGHNPTSSSGTNEHMRDFHAVHGTRAKIKSIRRAAVARNRMKYDGKLVAGTLRPGYDIGRDGQQRKIGFDMDKARKPQLPQMPTMVSPGVYVPFGGNAETPTRPHGSGFNGTSLGITIPASEVG